VGKEWDSAKTKTRENTRGTHLVEEDGRVSEEKELVGTRNEDSPSETDNPDAESVGRHRGIVCIGDRGSDFGVWGLLLECRGRRVDIRVIIVIDENVLRTNESACVCVNDNQGERG